ncbi:DUF4031 domain-containing protein [Bradyrhizobium manausense]|uniref:DUF4031 domain-containing protein n=1 Tax=Bradyrhizobium TaxID=374 RepID=UPI001BAC8D09|nr:MULTISPECIES: DUF4031 domain-containing protein [Bradyrhizobium]MBR0825157.1 DUF4031 domain-containing protein [Bradyrhizobium manausense]UVO32401.1 DUF4031 domain-containing protein [Bradyrhizobium arachidis]
MAVYVDELESWGWKMRGREVQSCHMFTDQIDLAELHAMAAAIGMKRSWFQEKRTAPHYDLTASRRAAAVALGAVELGRRDSANIWKPRREAVAATEAVSSKSRCALHEGGSSCHCPHCGKLNLDLDIFGDPVGQDFMCIRCGKEITVTAAVLTKLPGGIQLRG